MSVYVGDRDGDRGSSRSVATAPAPAVMMAAPATMHPAMSMSVSALDQNDRIVCAAAVLAGAIPSRAEAGIAIERAETTIAAVITRIRLIFGSSRREDATCYHNFPTDISFHELFLFLREQLLLWSRIGPSLFCSACFS